ncbi:MAG: glycosyltransferase [Thermodesulfovibrio sp.]|nr:glycosyltransferase [Thermodesulfovibrio sp.]
MPLISILIPVYNEEDNLPLFYERLRDFAGTSEDSYEFIFVDDGSEDRSFQILKDLATRDSRIRVVRLSRNFGSHAACLAGLISSSGEACVSMPADLQDPLELIQRMTAEWKNGYEIVFGVKETGKRGPRLFQRIYYGMVRKLALRNMPRTGVDLFFLDRRVVDVIISIREKNTSILGLILWSGFSQATVAYKKEPRLRGVSKWTTAKKMKLFIDTFVSFSYFPVRSISVVGMIVSLLGFLYAIYIIVNRLLFAFPIEGWASLMVILLVVSGIQMMMLGILGEYLWRNFDESRKRPSFIIKETVGMKETE